MKSSYKLLIFISVLIFSLSLFGELTISSEELKSILSYSENIYYSRSQFVFGKTGQYLSKLIVENDVEQKVTEGFFGLSSDFYLAIKEGWNKFDLTHNVKEAVFIYLPYYESVTNAFRLTDSNSINWIYFLYMNNLGVFLESMGFFNYYEDINNFLFANLKYLTEMNSSAFVVKSYIYFNRGVIYLHKRNYIAATHYFYLSHLVNNKQKEDLLTLSDIRDKTVREEYRKTKEFEILKILLETPSILSK